MRRPLVHRFSEVWRTDTGQKVRVSMQDAPDISQEADFQPRRIAVVDDNSAAGAGTIIYGQGTAYLLINQTNLTNVQRFRALETTHRLPWTRIGRINDPVTGLPRSTGHLVLSPSLPVVIEPERDVIERGIARPKNYVYTGADVALGDMIGTFEVEKIVLVLGVKRLEVV